MFDKDECLKALQGLRMLERAENFEKWGGQVAPQIKCDVIERLIKVHFYKTKPKFKVLSRIQKVPRYYCGVCDKRLAKTWKVCPRCGTEIDWNHEDQ